MLQTRVSIQIDEGFLKLVHSLNTEAIISPGQPLPQRHDLRKCFVRSSVFISYIFYLLVCNKLYDLTETHTPNHLHHSITIFHTMKCSPIYTALRNSSSSVEIIPFSVICCHSISIKASCSVFARFSTVGWDPITFGKDPTALTSLV